MATLSPAPPAVTPDAPDTEFDVPLARLMASKLIARNITAASIREEAVRRPDYAFMWSAIASQMDALAASVPAQRTPAEIARWDATIGTAEACDSAAGITDPGTVAARAAFAAATVAGGKS
jgi:hypothetical protein